MQVRKGRNDDRSMGNRLKWLRHAREKGQKRRLQAVSPAGDMAKNMDSTRLTKQGRGEREQAGSLGLGLIDSPSKVMTARVPGAHGRWYPDGGSLLTCGEGNEIQVSGCRFKEAEFLFF